MQSDTICECHPSKSIEIRLCFIANAMIESDHVFRDYMRSQQGQKGFPFSSARAANSYLKRNY